MNITLRKANAIQHSILEAIKSIKIVTEISINEFQDVTVEITKANTNLFANDERRHKLMLAYYNIRGLVGAANATAGIDLALTKAAFVDKRIAQLEELAKAEVHTDVKIIEGKLDKIRNNKESDRSRIYGYHDTVNTTVLSEDQIKQARAEIQNLKKQKQKLNDEVLELNIKTEVPLTDEVVATLQAEGLV
jgi:uncharacterized protein YdcH (DUF465 family)